MKSTVVLIALCILLGSCQKNDLPAGISLEQALSEQFVSFDIRTNEVERSIFIQEFNANVGPFYHFDDSQTGIDFDPITSYPIVRPITVAVPEDQVMENHIENFALRFNKVFPKEDIDPNTNSVIDSEQFRSEFLTIGEQDIERWNFLFHQTYVITVGDSEERVLRVTNIQEVLGNDKLIFVTGEFSGLLGNDPLDAHWGIRNGNFKLLIEN